MPFGHLIDSIKSRALLALAAKALIIDAVIVMTFALTSPLTKFAAYLVIASATMVPLYRPAVNLYVVESRQKDRAMIIGLMHAASALSQFVLPLMALTWNLNPVLTIVLFSAGSRFAASLYLLKYRRPS